MSDELICKACGEEIRQCTCPPQPGEPDNPDAWKLKNEHREAEALERIARALEYLAVKEGFKRL